MKNIRAMLPLILVLLTTPRIFAEDPGWSAVRLNQEGALLLKAQNFTAAQDRFIQALSKMPTMAAIHINLGLAFEGLQQVEKAQASFETAIKLAQDDKVKFIAEFNLGELLGKAKKIDEALVAYQAALDLKPDSRETKVNIELLIKDQDKKGKGGDSKDDKDKDKDNKDQKDKKDQDQKKDPKDNKDDKKDDKDKEGDKPKQYDKSKPQPKPFKSDELTQGDVNKILGELKQQEQKIRAEFNRREAKEKPRDKDW